MIKTINFWDENKKILTQPVIIAISGLARHGKTTLAKYMSERFNMTFEDENMTALISFAGAVKHCAYKQFGWEGSKDAKGRKLLQDIGEIGRRFNQDIWADIVFRGISHLAHLGVNIFIIDDWRYPNELKYLQDNGPFQIITMRIFRDIPTDDELYKHESETSLPEDPNYYDITVYNTGTLENLNENTTHLVSLLIKGEEIC